jgi:hypothetical protein
VFTKEKETDPTKQPTETQQRPNTYQEGKKERRKKKKTFLLLAGS